ncbi:MAG: hypothetical protein QXM53_09900, partial [Thermofilaceae archaeon]
MIYPFAAIVDQEEMKLALVLNVIDPSIGGVLIMGEKGTGKSTAVRALAELLPEIEVVQGCPFNCDPKGPLCTFCEERKERESSLPTEKKKMLVGSMNPEEGELRPQFLDRFGLCVEVRAIVDKKLRYEVLRRR